MTHPARIAKTAALAIITACATPLQADDSQLAKSLESIDQTIAKGPYKPEWASLKAHQDPEWFRDAKFGIYTHWGPVTVGAEDGPAGVQWYGKSMYDPNSPTFLYHLKKYGDQHQTSSYPFILLQKHLPKGYDIFITLKC